MILNFLATSTALLHPPFIQFADSVLLFCDWFLSSGLGGDGGSWFDDFKNACLSLFLRKNARYPALDVPWTLFECKL